MEIELASKPLRRYFQFMTKLEKIEREIETLAPQDVIALGLWLDELREKLWDVQIEHDATSGKLDRLAAETRAEIAAGRFKAL